MQNLNTQDSTSSPSLADLAEQALRQLILAGKLSPGDLIKLLGQGGGGSEGPGADFVIRLVED